MPGEDGQTGALFSYLSPDALVSLDHPLRAIRPLVNAALLELSPKFEGLYANGGRIPIAPKKRGKGFHAVVPLRPEADWGIVKPFCRAFAETMATNEPTRFLAHLKIADRSGHTWLTGCETDLALRHCRPTAGGPVRARASQHH